MIFCLRILKACQQFANSMDHIKMFILALIIMLLPDIACWNICKFHISKRSETFSIRAYWEDQKQLAC